MKTSHKIVCFVAALITISGCTKETFFELKHPPANPWVSFQSYSSSVNGVWNQLAADGWNVPYEQVIVWDWLSSDVCRSAGTDREFIYMYERNQQNYPVTGSYQGFQGIWKAAFAGITACTDPLTWIEKEEAKGKKIFVDVNEAQEKDGIARVKAELLTLKAYTYFNVAEMWGSPYFIDNPSPASLEKRIPLKYSFVDDPQMLASPVLGSTKDVYNLIKADLKKAKDFYKSISTPVKSQEITNGHSNYYVACGILARLYFKEHNYDSARYECDEIINSHVFSLSEDPIEAFNKGMASGGLAYDKMAAEVMWNFPAANLTIYQQQPFRLYNIGIRNYACMGGGRGQYWTGNISTWTTANLTEEAVAYMGWMKDPLHGDDTETSMAKMDKRYQQLCWRFLPYKKRPPIPTPPPGSTPEQIAKLRADFILNWDSTVSKNPKTKLISEVVIDKFYRNVNNADYATAFPLMRVAEFYLTRAILNYKAGNISQAMLDVNAVRRRAGLPDFTFITEDSIHVERMKEFLGEGDRNRYLMSLNLPLEPGKIYTQTGSAYLRPESKRVMPPYEQWRWSIPQEELDANLSY
jgi:hypothetical protein